jgi:hypothetical protein
MLGSLRCLVFCAAFAATAQGANVIVNGDFESGNVGFASDYDFTDGANCCEGEYTVRDNGSTFNPAFVNPLPATQGSVLMMVINGSTVPNQRIWYTTVAVTPGGRYELRLMAATAVSGGPAVLQWAVGGQLIGASQVLPMTPGLWVEVTAQWDVPDDMSFVEVAVFDLNTSTFPNDFYLDNLEMSEVCTVPDFVGCLLGPDLPVLSACACVDLDGDGDGDLMDFALYQQEFVGP